MSGRRRFGRSVLLLPLALLSAATSPARAGGAAALGLAGAYQLRARGADAPVWNPATLAWSHALDVRVVAAGGSLHNNAFSLGDYRRWNGAVLDDQDKDAILALIPGAFLRGAASADAEGPGVAWRGWALTTMGRAEAAMAMPKEYGRLLFYGNVPDQGYDLSGTDGEGTAWSELGLSHGRPLGEVRFAGRRAALAGGLTVKWLQGWGYGDILRTRGAFITTMSGLSGDQEITWRSAAGGRGFACDLGLAARTGAWQVGLTVHNAVSHLSWTRRVEEHTERAWADSLTVDDLQNDENSDIVRTEETARAIGSFATTLPAELGIAAKRNWGGFDWEADLTQGFADRSGSSATPRFALGASRRPWRFLEGRAGIAVGGVDGPVVAAGLGLSAWKVRCDLAMATAHGINFGSPHGLQAGLSLGLRWGPVED